MDDNLLPRWLVVLYVFGIVDEVSGLIEPLAHLNPTVRPGTDSLVFISLVLIEPSAEAATKYAKLVVERTLRRSAMVQTVIQA